MHASRLPQATPDQAHTRQEIPITVTKTPRYLLQARIFSTPDLAGWNETVMIIRVPGACFHNLRLNSRAEWTRRSISFTGSSNAIFTPRHTAAVSLVTVNDVVDRVFGERKRLSYEAKA